MLVRQLRAILAKLPDDANVQLRLRETYIDVKSTLYSHSRNSVALTTDPLEASLAMDNFIRRSIDNL